jgi:hypothetical protein
MAQGITIGASRQNLSIGPVNLSAELCTAPAAPFTCTVTWCTLFGHPSIDPALMIRMLIIAASSLSDRSELCAETFGSNTFAEFDPIAQS